MDAFLWLVYRRVVAPLLRWVVFSGLFTRIPGLPSKLRATLELKQRAWPHAPAAWSDTRPIWIHFSSGELEYAKPVLRELRTRWPLLPLLGTFSSPSVAGAAARIKELDLVLPLPVDHDSEWDRFHALYRPAACLVARTDLWPLMAEACALRSVPILLFAGTFGPGSSRRKRWLGSLLTRPLSHSSIMVVHGDDLAELRALVPAAKATVGGDPRYDQVRWRLEKRGPLPGLLHEAKQNWLRSQTWTLGSIWQPDWHALRPAVEHWLGIPGTSMIVVPHEPQSEFIELIESDLNRLGVVSYQRLSRATKLDPETRVLIADSVGFLAETYLISGLAFVGGSFVKRVHSVMEPLAAGCLTLVGPHHTNNREAIEFQKRIDQTGHLTYVQKISREPRDQIEKLSRAQALLRQENLSSSIQLAVRANEGSTRNVIDWLCREVDPQPHEATLPCE